MRASKEELASSLKGFLSIHHRFMLGLIKKSILEKEALLTELDQQIYEHLKAHEMKLDAKLLENIPGLGKDAAASILAEIGNDMDKFPTAQHLASWAGMSPGNDESAGKKKVAASRTGINI